jgi:hypothetical protein
VRTIVQMAQRAKAAIMTQPEEGDPLAANYGDSPLIASEQRSGRVWTPVHALSPEMKDQKVSGAC